MSEEMKAVGLEELGQRTTEVAPRASVVTRMVFAAPAERVWKGLVFYEALGGAPSTPPALALARPDRHRGQSIRRRRRGDLSLRRRTSPQAHHENRTGRPLRIRSRRASAVRRGRHAAFGRPVHVARPARRANRSRRRDALRQSQMAALVLEAAREDGLPLVPPLPLGDDATPSRSGLKNRRA